jgi:S1-C subfamily serine protease
MRHAQSVFCGLLVLLLSNGVALHAEQKSAVTSQGITVTSWRNLQESLPAVVIIEVYDLTGKVSGTESGFLVGADGRILTNYNAIAHTKQANVRLARGDAYDTVEVLDVDKRKDCS